MLNLDLILDGQPGAYTVAAQGPQGIRVAPLPINEQVIARILPLAEELQYGEALSADELRALGTHLSEVLFPLSIYGALQRSLGVVENEQLRLRLIIRPAPLARLPWELTYDVLNQRYLAARHSMPLVRYIERGAPERSLRPAGALRVLYVTANPEGTARLDLTRSEAQLRAALHPLEAANKVELVPLRDATPDALRAELRQGYHVLHYDGHGGFDARREQGMLLLRDDAGGIYRLPGDLLARFLDGTTVRLALLMACETAKGGTRNPAAGVAQQLIVTADVPAVIGMQFPIGDASAAAFGAEFYRALTADYPVDAAVAEGRKAIMTLGGADWESVVDWAAPVVYLRAADGYIWARAAEINPLWQPEIAREYFEPETVLVPAGAFLMGSQPSAGAPAHETPQHEVDLPAYRIGKYAVTNAEYAEFLKHEKQQDAPQKAGWFLREPPAGKLRHPVVGVSWHDAQAYCRWLSAQTGRTYRLPTEAEWEKAASWTAGAGKRVYPWGNEFADERCNSAAAGVGSTISVGQYSPAGDSGYGCADMAGNVQEWTSTLWGYDYPYRADDGRDDPAADEHQYRVQRVQRGGSFRDDADKLRCCARGYSSPDSKIKWRGFRVVLDLEESQHRMGNE